MENEKQVCLQLSISQLKILDAGFDCVLIWGSLYNTQKRKACIFAIKNITPEPLYSVYAMSNLPAQDIDYDETIEVSIQSVYLIK